MLLAADELVANVIKHGTGEGETMTVSIVPASDCLRFEVCSDDGGFDPNESPPGWGLYLLSRIATRWGAERRSHAWCVWFEKDLDSVRG
jgi:two-component sensor histidine kinase